MIESRNLQFLKSPVTKQEVIQLINQLSSNSSVKSVSFINQTSITVNHNSGYKPLVQVFSASGSEIIVSIEHINTSTFIVSSNVSITGTINYI